MIVFIYLYMHIYLYIWKYEFKETKLSGKLKTHGEFYYPDYSANNELLRQKLTYIYTLCLYKLSKTFIYYLCITQFNNIYT